MLLVILLEGASKEVVTPSSKADTFYGSIQIGMLISKKFEKLFKTRKWKQIRRCSGN